MEQSQNKHLKAIIILLFLILATNLLVLLAYFSHIVRTVTNANNVAYVSLQQESSPFDNEQNDYIKLHNILSQSLKYHEFYNQPLFNKNDMLSFFEAYSGNLERGCEEIASSQIGQMISDRLDIVQGRNFVNSDFMHNEGSTVPVILGNSYTSIFNIGDKFNLEYLYDNYEFEVVGILKKDSIIELNMTYYLDKSIIMPFFTIPVGTELTDGEIIHYANYTSGVVEIPNDKFSADMKFIKNVLNQKICGEYSYAIQQQNYYWKDYLGVYPKSIRSLLTVFWIIAIILLVISFVKNTLSLKLNVVLLFLSLVISAGLNIFWTWFGFSVSLIYYMVIPIIYFSGILIKVQIRLLRLRKQ